MTKLLVQATFNLVLVATIGLCGCARFSTVQIDERYDEKTSEKTTITTKVTATTLFDSSSALATFKASQTEKTQGASVGSLTQQSSSTNLNRIIESITSGAVQGAVKATNPVQ